MEVAPKQIRRKFSVVQNLQISQPFGSVHVDSNVHLKETFRVGIAISDRPAVCHGGLAIKSQEGLLILGEEGDFYMVKSMSKVHETGLVPKNYILITSPDKNPRNKVLNWPLRPLTKEKEKTSLRTDGGRGSLQAKYFAALSQNQAQPDPNSDKQPVTVVPQRFIDTPGGRVVEFHTALDPVYRTVDEVYALLEKVKKGYPRYFNRIPPQTLENLNSSILEIECFMADIFSLSKDGPNVSILTEFVKERASDPEIRIRSNSAPTLTGLPFTRILSEDDDISPRDSTAFKYLPKIKIKLHYSEHIYAFWLQNPSYTELYDHLISRIGLPPSQVWYQLPTDPQRKIPLSSQLDFMEATQYCPKTLRVFVDE